MDDPSETLARVCRRLDQLEDRVSAIEHMPQPAIPLAVHNLVAQAQVRGSENALPQPVGVFPVVGRAMLGIAGAYVLRAVAESGAVPKLAVESSPCYTEARGWYGLPGYGFRLA